MTQQEPGPEAAFPELPLRVMTVLSGLEPAAPGKVLEMIVLVLEAGFLWRVRVLQGPAARHRTITSALSVVQVRMASSSCLSVGCPNVHPTNLETVSSSLSFDHPE
jgi:hypothetical protein